jgi:hypothetical protein
MVQSARPLSLTERIDAELRASFSTWHGVQADAAEWDEWDEDSKLLYDIEYCSMAFDRLGRLERWAEAGQMTAEQRARYDQLLALVEKTRPLLRQMGVGPEAG